MAIYALKDGGTKEQEIEPERQDKQALTDEQILQLEHMGRKIEEHFGYSQDIGWCLVDNTFYIVQSRPITTLYPIPEANDKENHVYVSVGHQQMMTDPIKPLVMSLFKLTSFGPRFKAGGRLFVDVTQMLDSPDSRENLLNSGFEAEIEKDLTIVSHLIRKSERSIEELKQNIQGKSGSDLFDFILEDIQELKKILFDSKNTAVFMAAINASSWINEKMKEWLDEKNVADKLSQSVQNNITSEMGLALLDVVDVIRPYPEVVDYLLKEEVDNYKIHSYRLSAFYLYAVILSYSS